MPSAALGAAPPAPSYFVNDTFTGTLNDDLATGHTGETGATWTKNTATPTGAFAITDSNRVFNNASGTLYPSGTPADADYYVEGDFYTKSLQNNANGANVCIRFSTTVLSGYLFGWVGDSGGTGHGNWKLRVATTGTFTDLVVVTAETLVVSTHYIVRLTATGNILTGSINGVDVATYDITPDAVKYTAAGVPSLRMQGNTSNTTGIHADYFRALD